MKVNLMHWCMNYSMKILFLSTGNSVLVPLTSSVSNSCVYLQCMTSYRFNACSTCVFKLKGQTSR